MGSNILFHILVIIFSSISLGEEKKRKKFCFVCGEGDGAVLFQYFLYGKELINIYIYHSLIFLV